MHFFKSALGLLKYSLQFHVTCKIIDDFFHLEYSLFKFNKAQLTSILYHHDNQAVS